MAGWGASSPLHFFLCPLFLSSSRSGHREAKILNFLRHRWIAVIYLFIFWLFPKYLSSPRAIWELLIWTLKEQWVSWPRLFTGKQRAWPKNPSASFLDSSKSSNRRWENTASQVISLLSGIWRWILGGFLHTFRCSTNTQCGSNDDRYADDTHTSVL